MEKQFIKVHTLKNKEKQQSIQDIREQGEAKFEDKIPEKSVNEDEASTFPKFEKKMIAMIEIVQLTKIKFFITLMQMKIQFS